MKTKIYFNKKWLVEPPSQSKGWLVIPIFYLFFIQLLTGIPQPQTLNPQEVGEFWVSFSEELFSYPFWLQDLSHLPLFFIFAWSWAWYLGPVKLVPGIHKNFCLHMCLSYSCLNEFSQFFIPMRFPSPGDLIMNLAGVCLGLLFHQFMNKCLASQPSI